MKILLAITITILTLSQSSLSFETNVMESCTKDPNQKKCEPINLSTRLRALIAMKDHWACKPMCDDLVRDPNEYKKCKTKCLNSQKLAATKLFGLTSSELAELLKEFEESHPGSKLHDLYKEKTEK